MKTFFSCLLAAAALSAAAPAARADTPFVGEIRNFGFNFCPRGWAALDGQLLAVSSNDALFSLLGTIYGGDGRTTFGLPDLRGRIALHTGTGPGLSPRPLGSKGGAETNVMNTTQLPSHTHAPAGPLEARLVGGSGTPDTNSPAGAYLGTASSGNFYASAEGTKKDMDPGHVTVDLSGEIIANTGNSSAIQNMAPTLVSRWCIALTGIYPSRS